MVFKKSEMNTEYQKRRTEIGLLLVVILVSCPIYGAIPAASEVGEDDDYGAINLAIVLHMHQPYYKNIESGFYELPWVRVHGATSILTAPAYSGCTRNKCYLQYRAIPNRTA